MSSTLSQVMSKGDAVFSSTDQAALEQLVRARIEASSAERLRSRRAIERWQPLEAKNDPVRLATVSQRPRLMQVRGRARRLCRRMRAQVLRATHRTLRPARKRFRAAVSITLMPRNTEMS